MTIDDDNSIYVGGIPYDCNEDDLRRAFELYGAIVAVKIINDRGIGGKCYAFVTFTNPRSTIDAIDDMNGRTIGGRVVKVNEVKTRGAGGRSNYGREAFRRNERRVGWARGRGRDRDDYEHERDQYRDHSWEREQEREREGGYDHVHFDDRTGDRFYERDEAEARGTEESNHGHSRDHDYEVERDRKFDHDGQHSRDSHGRRTDKDKVQCSKKRSRSSSYDQHSRELSSESSDYDRHKLEEQLELLMQGREELRKEKSEMDQRLEEKKQLVVDLQRKSLKLEDALSSAKKVSLLRQSYLTKMRKCFLHVKEYSERLKNSERELQYLAESVMLDIDVDADGLRDGHLTNGKADNSFKKSKKVIRTGGNV